MLSASYGRIIRNGIAISIWKAECLLKGSEAGKAMGEALSSSSG
jgi:hypothetical protein